MLTLCSLVMLGFVATLLCLARALRRAGRRIRALERRIAVLENDNAPTLVSEPTLPPRLPHQLPN